MNHYVALLALALVLPPPPVLARESGARKELAISEKPVCWTEKQSNGHVLVKAKILIAAPAQTIWKALHDACERDPDVVRRTVISREANEEILDEQLAWQPLIGTAKCRIHRVETACKRMDYWMISSDKLKALEGSWVLMPGPGKHSHYLELSSYCDIGIPVPRLLRNTLAAQKLESRLTRVKNAAEVVKQEVTTRQPSFSDANL